MQELDELISKTASALKNIFIKYFSTKSDVELLKIKKILYVYFSILQVLKKKHPILVYAAKIERDYLFINHCYAYLSLSDKILKKMSEDNIKNFCEYEN